MNPLPWKRAVQPRGEEAAAGDHEAALRTSDRPSFSSYDTCVYSWLFFFYGSLLPRDVFLSSVTHLDWETMSTMPTGRQDLQLLQRNEAGFSSTIFRMTSGPSLEESSVA